MSEQDKEEDKVPDPDQTEVVIPVVEEKIIRENGEEVVRRYEVHIEEVDTGEEPEGS